MYKNRELEYSLAQQRAAELAGLIGTPEAQTNEWRDSMTECLITGSVMRLDAISLPAELIKKAVEDYRARTYLMRAVFAGGENREMFFQSVRFAVWWYNRETQNPT